jgi:hypothetical protein
MKKNAAVAAVLMMVLMTSASMFGQYTGRMNVTVPFNFVVENTQFHAGDYVIEKIANGRLRIHTDDGRISANFIAIPTEGKETAERATFTFRRYGHEYFLSKIMTPGLNVGWEVMEGKAEQELAKKSGVRVEMATVIGR